VARSLDSLQYSNMKCKLQSHGYGLGGYYVLMSLHALLVWNCCYLIISLKTNKHWLGLRIHSLVGILYWTQLIKHNQNIILTLLMFQSLSEIFVSTDGCFYSTAPDSLHVFKWKWKSLPWYWYVQNLVRNTAVRSICI